MEIDPKNVMKENVIITSISSFVLQNHVQMLHPCILTCYIYTIGYTHAYMCTLKEIHIFNVTFYAHNNKNYSKKN